MPTHRLVSTAATAAATIGRTPLVTIAQEARQKTQEARQETDEASAKDKIAAIEEIMAKRRQAGVGALVDIPRGYVPLRTKSLPLPLPGATPPPTSTGTLLVQQMFFSTIAGRSITDSVATTTGPAKSTSGTSHDPK